MNLKQALYVKTIAETGSLTAAAKQLYISQPSLSQMLRTVEAESGIALFDRSMQPLRLTYAGEKYLEAAESMLLTEERLQKQFREIRNEQAGRLRIGISVSRAYRCCRSLFRHLHRAIRALRSKSMSAGPTRWKRCSAKERSI